MKFRAKKCAFLKSKEAGGVLLFLTLLVSFALPGRANAGFLSIFKTNAAPEPEVVKEEPRKNSQTLQLLQAATTQDNEGGRGGGDITVESSALLPEVGPLGTAADIKSEYLSDQIFNYVVRKGDTLRGIAKMFDVSEGTIMWANDLKRGEALTVGKMLVILPISGVEHTIQKGDTLKSLAKKYRSDLDEISKYNGLTEESVLAVGDKILIPDAELVDESATPTKSSAPVKYNGPQYVGYYLRPVAGGYRTQGIHGRNGVDLGGLPIGTPIIASAEGVITVSRNSGWNGGYGKYVVISHPNGTQTLYSHLNESIVSVGQRVNQGQVIGFLGNTGKSTGPHIHFEIRGGPRNPF